MSLRPLASFFPLRAVLGSSSPCYRRYLLEYAIGVVLALAIGLFATLVGFDRDRTFYPTVTVVIASYYALFAVVGGAPRELWLETAFIAAFAGLAVAGFKKSLWFVVAALFLHGVFDLVHGKLVENPGVPVWWPGFCLAYDLGAAGYLAMLLRRSNTRNP